MSNIIHIFSQLYILVVIYLLEFLDAVLGVVIGVEFLKMLCKPNTANIIEALIFVIARQMIVQTTTAGEDLVSVISICTVSYTHLDVYKRQVRCIPLAADCHSWNKS